MRKVAISAKKLGEEFLPVVTLRDGRQRQSWPLDAVFSSQTDALDHGYLWAHSASWTNPVTVLPPYTRAAWATPWSAMLGEAA